MAARTISYVLRAPHLVERSVRGALSRWLERRGPERVLDLRAFTNDALTFVSRCARDEDAPLDPTARYELEASTVAACGRFARSKLAARLAALDAASLRTGVSTYADVLIVDAGGRRHAVRLESLARGAERAALAEATARAASSGGHAGCAVHLFSLRDGRLRTFESAGASGSRERAS